MFQHQNKFNFKSTKQKRHFDMPFFKKNTVRHNTNLYYLSHNIYIMSKSNHTYIVQFKQIKNNYNIINLKTIITLTNKQKTQVLNNS